MSRRRHRRRAEKERRHAQPPAIVRQAARVERLAYTRTQAAQALGISRSTFTRLLPFIETVELPWGTKLVPVDELERLIAERRRSARERTQPASPGRPPTLSLELVRRIRAERAAGKTLRQIARDLNASGLPTAHGGAQWWPSTVRAVLRREERPASRAPAPSAQRQHIPILAEFQCRDAGGISAGPVGTTRIYVM